MELRTQAKTEIRARLNDVQIRTGEETGDGQPTVTGYAAVFNLLSGDLGGFREQLAPGAFTEVLSRNPDVHINQDHDMRLVLGRTLSKTLELTEVERGLKIWNKLPATTYAEDLRIVMERGDIDQMSFCFTIDEEEWHEDSDGTITSTILKVRDLYDVCVCAQGAYPQAESVIEQHKRSRLEAAIAGGVILGQGDDEAARERSAADRSRRISLARAR